MELRYNLKHADVFSAVNLALFHYKNGTLMPTYKPAVDFPVSDIQHDGCSTFTQKNTMITVTSKLDDEETDKSAEVVSFNVDFIAEVADMAKPDKQGRSAQIRTFDGKETAVMESRRAILVKIAGARLDRLTGRFFEQRH